MHHGTMGAEKTTPWWRITSFTDAEQQPSPQMLVLEERRRRRRLEVVLGAVDRVPDEIHGHYRGNAHLCGSFTNWLETYP